MKVLILSSNNPYKASGIASLYLYKGLKKRGHTIQMVVKEYDQYLDKNIVSLDNQRNLIDKIRNRTKKIIYKIFKLKNPNEKFNQKYNILDYDQTIENYSTKDVLKKVKFNPDIILYMFPNNFLNTKNLYEIGQFTGAPIYWYLMDSAALTGGCHYFWDCDRYIHGCGSCPGLYSNDKNDQTFRNFNFKREYLKKTNINVISGTDRLRFQTESGRMFRGKSVYKILLPVDHEVFMPGSKSDLRNELNIPAQKIIIFIGSQYLSTDRKGIEYSMQALKLIKNKDEVFLIIAGHQIEYLDNKIPVEFKYLGSLANNEQLASAYQVSDLFVCPSIEDAGPLMINQSIMCGTPVVSFAMGVANDLVKDGITGFKAELMNSIDLAEKIDSFLSLSEEEQNIMSNNCRNTGLKYLKQNVFVDEFESIFKEKLHHN